MKPHPITIICIIVPQVLLAFFLAFFLNRDTVEEVTENTPTSDEYRRGWEDGYHQAHREMQEQFESVNFYENDL